MFSIAGDVQRKEPNHHSGNCKCDQKLYHLKNTPEGCEEDLRTSIHVACPWLSAL
ncbi:hypothetical protein EXN66_Car020590 [Channa argus]|uniref:Uncharacterized protein n=1 Tax=Channa argus TaxID=215402 RepID=A0A6G1QQA7_CHAAH|nr:hypothetical protein EXN66_Car020590 [Channa argus]